MIRSLAIWLGIRAETPDWGSELLAVVDGAGCSVLSSGTRIWVPCRECGARRNIHLPCRCGAM